VTTTEPSLSEGRSEAPEPGRRGTLSIGAWLPTWDLITTKNLEIRKRRGLMITLVVLIVVPTVLFYGTQLPYFIDGQRLIIGIAMDQLRPAALAAGAAGGGGGGGPGLFGGRGALGIPPMPTWAMISVIVGWIVGWSVIGAWRMMSRDA